MANYLRYVDDIFPSLVSGGRKASRQMPRIDGTDFSYGRQGILPDNTAIDVDAVEVFDALPSSSRGALVKPELNTIYEDYRGLPGWALPAALGGSAVAGYGYTKMFGDDSSSQGGGSTPVVVESAPEPEKPSSTSVVDSAESAPKEGDMIRYKIKKGDTLWGMTEDWDQINAIAKANNIADPNMIYADAYINLTPEQDLLRRALAKGR